MGATKMTLQEKILKRKLSKKEKHKLKIIEDRQKNGDSEETSIASTEPQNEEQVSVKRKLDDNSDAVKDQAKKKKKKHKDKSENETLQQAAENGDDMGIGSKEKAQNEDNTKSKISTK